MKKGYGVFAFKTTRSYLVRTTSFKFRSFVGRIKVKLVSLLCFEKITCFRGWRKGLYLTCAVVSRDSLEDTTGRQNVVQESACVLNSNFTRETLVEITMNGTDAEFMPSQIRAIPSRRVVVNDPSHLPVDYSTTPGGTIFSTTPGGTFVLFWIISEAILCSVLSKLSFLYLRNNCYLLRHPVRWTEMFVCISQLIIFKYDLSVHFRIL